jgi:hypothetical protein
MPTCALITISVAFLYETVPDISIIEKAIMYGNIHILFWISEFLGENLWKYFT